MRREAAAEAPLDERGGASTGRRKSRPYSVRGIPPYLPPLASRAKGLGLPASCTTRFVGMDVHKETIVVAVTATGEVGKATAYGTFPNTAAGLEKLVKRLRQAGSGAIKFCYEAGPCGYGVHRTLTRMGEACMVVAPSMIPLGGCEFSGWLNSLYYMR